MSLPVLNRVHRIDALWGFRSLPAESVQCIVTSPPYWGLRDYGERGQIGLEPTPEEYVARLVAIFAEARRTLRDDGILWLNLGDCYANAAGKVGHCPGGGQQGARWRGEVGRLRDEKRGYRGDRLANGRGDSPAIQRRKTRATRDGSHAGKNTGISALGPMTQPNRMPIPGLKPKDLVGIPWRVAFALQRDGWYLRSDIIWAKSNPMPESVRDRPTKCHEYVFLLSKSARYYYDAAAISEAVTYGDHPRNGCPGPDIQAPGQPKQSGITKKRRSGNKERVLGPGRCRPGSALGAGVPWEDLNGLRNARSVWTIPTSPYPGAHFATFPEQLPERCIRAGTKPGDLVCDPFAGAGTAGVVAVRLGRRFVGFDLAGGDKDLGGHTANERIANPFLSLAEIGAGQLSISGGGP